MTVAARGTSPETGPGLVRLRRRPVPGHRETQQHVPKTVTSTHGYGRMTRHASRGVLLLIPNTVHRGALGLLGRTRRT